MTKVEKIIQYISERQELLRKRHCEHIKEADYLHEHGNYTDEEWERARARETYVGFNELSWLKSHIVEEILK